MADSLSSAMSKQPRLPVWMTYLWQRKLEHHRLGLVLGAGVSYDAKIPLWPELLNRLAEAAGVTPERQALHKKERFSETFLAEIIFRKHDSDCTTEDPRDHFHGHRVNVSWKSKVRECIYKDIKNKSFSEIAQGHPYLRELANLICQSGFAVTFNFDDIVDQAVAEHVENTLKAAPEANIANPEIIYHPKIETRKHAPVIYHINGSIPRDELRRSSEKIILTEDAFADVLLSPNSYNAEYVINQFSLKTFVLLGISLTDNSLKNILRSSAKRNPANHHFIIVHEKENEPRSDEVRQDIFEVNLHVYNLISIFLTTGQIKEFITLLNSSESSFDDAILANGAPSTQHRKYYIVGSVASGKSSTIDALRCFTTFEEFSGRVPKEMYRDDNSLSPEEQRIVDDYLFPRLIEKSRNMTLAHSGLRVMDRAFLDLFAFSKNGNHIEIKRKAHELKDRLHKHSKALENGHLVFLYASEKALEERLLKRGSRNDGGKTGFAPETLTAQKTYLQKIYRVDDAKLLDTSHLEPGEVARIIAREILLKDYEEFDFAKRLDEIIAADGAL